MSPVLNIIEAAYYTKLRERALQDLVERGEIPYRKQGKTLLFLREELDWWLGHLAGVKAEDLQHHFDEFTDHSHVTTGDITPLGVTTHPSSNGSSKPHAGRLLGE